MMTDIKWSDNICTVGWTCITARISPDEMDWLKLYCPEGRFSACFPVHGKPIYNRIDFEYFMKKSENGTYLGRVFYFDFPLDNKGVTLLKALCFINHDVEANDVKRLRST